MNTLSLEKKVKIIQLLTEGNSLRSVSRIVDVSINTVTRLLVLVGQACLKFHSHTVIHVEAKRLEIDEQWSFVAMKQKNVKEEKFGIGDCWTWVALDPDTKLVISFFVGKRDMQSAKFFMKDVKARLKNRVQITSDGYKVYEEAIEDIFRGRVDYAQLVKQYSNDSTNKDGKKDKRERYIGALRIPMCGNPDKKLISTSIVERQNLTSRMINRRMTRDTNAYSKKYENHCYATALMYTYYNFVRRHHTLRVTPAMAAGLTKKFMSYADIVELIDLY